MKHALMVVSLLSAVPAAAAERILCSLNAAPAAPCAMTVSTRADGARVVTFVLARQPVRIVAKAQTGWWSGTFNGRPAMGYEVNRSYTRFSTTDLSTTFDWWYPGQNHGTY